MQALQDNRHTPQTRQAITGNIREFEDRREVLGGLTPAAVAVTVFRHGQEAAVMLTQRASRLRSHGGQWALPGGRIDSGESAEQAAARELQEEVNLSLDVSRVIGRLDDYVTRSGYLITPVVFWADEDDRYLRPNPDEVESIHAFSFAELCRKESPHLESIAQSDREVLSMHYGDIRIYAPTAAVLYQFREVAISGLSTRVLHFDQPVFAWK
jgi:8-oxo-dGTP pyrophosphatase MutT (NUDIX family)